MKADAKIMKTPKRKLLSISAAARKQGCQRDTIYNWIDGGLKTHGGKIDPAELSAFAVTRSRKAPVIGHLAKAARAAEAAGGADAERITTELAAITGALDSGEGLDGALSRLKS